VRTEHLSNWSLHWPKGEIVTDKNVMTFIIRYSDDRSASFSIDNLKSHLEQCGFNTIYRQWGEDGLVSIEAGTGAGVGRQVTVHLWTLLDHAMAIVTCHDLKHRRAIRAFFDNEKNCILGELTHTTRILDCKRIHAVIITSTGNMTGPEEHDEPELQTVYELKIGAELVGMCLLSYYNGEMSDCAPTIQLFEIKEKYRGKRLGREFLQAIEHDVPEHGFDRIWATNIAYTDAVGFWERMGYDTEEVGEAFKRLSATKRCSMQLDSGI